VRKAYTNASIVGPDRAVFNIKGNSYRLVVAINYRLKIVFIKWVGSHAEYDQIDVRTVQSWKLSLLGTNKITGNR
jgi:mRNA interferase HigB